jgi:hypothetical protein
MTFKKHLPRVDKLEKCSRNQKDRYSSGEALKWDMHANELLGI